MRSGDSAIVALHDDRQAGLSPSFTTQTIDTLRVSASGMVATRTDQGIVFFDTGGRRALTFPGGEAVAWAPGELIAAVPTPSEILFVAPVSGEIVTSRSRSETSSGSCRDLRQPSLEEHALGGLARELQRLSVGDGGLGVAPKAPEQVGASRVEEVVAGELLREWLHQLEPVLLALGLRDRDRTVQLDDRAPRELCEESVQGGDPAQSVFSGDCPRVLGRDRRLRA